MQVVCERCTTAYDFPESNVPSGGVTVKCVGCGHRFRVVRVRRKTIPVMVPPTAGAVPPGEGPWTVRTARGESFPLPDITLLRGWIMERKVTRDDELANAAGLWRKLGSIPEYAGAFVEVDRAVATQRATPPIRTLDEFTAQSGTAKRGPPTIELKVPIGGFKKPPSPPPQTPAPRPHPRAEPQPVEEDALEAQPIRRWPFVVGGIVLLVALAAVAVRFGVQFLTSGPGKPYLEARELFLGDADLDLSRAEKAFRAITGADEALAKAGLAEVMATRAHYALLEAAEMEAAGRKDAAAERKREAIAQATDAQKLVEQAQKGGVTTPEANRALADALRVSGAPAGRIERLLGNVRAVLVADPESLYVEGALRLREGKRVIARNLLEEATQRFESGGGRPLIRAEYLLATVYLEGGKVDEAKERLKKIIIARPGHGRASALLEKIEGGPGGAAPPTSPPAGTEQRAPDGSVAAEPAAKTRGGGGGGPIDREIRNDYGALIAEADKVAEQGSGSRAQRLYQRALELKPNGVEALSGLGYCYLDDERYGVALRTFRRALGVDSRYGEAVIGLAEAYRLRDKPEQALEYYRRYLNEHPKGPRAAMARNNVRDLSFKLGEDPPPPPPAPEPKPEPEPEPEPPPPPEPAKQLADPEENPYETK